MIFVVDIKFSLRFKFMFNFLAWINVGKRFLLRNCFFLLSLLLLPSPTAFVLSNGWKLRLDNWLMKADDEFEYPLVYADPSRS